MKLRVIVELDPEANRFSAVFPKLPGCASAGDTEEEAIANAKEALACWPVNQAVIRSGATPMAGKSS